MYASQRARERIYRCSATIHVDTHVLGCMSRWRGAVTSAHHARSLAIGREGSHRPGEVKCVGGKGACETKCFNVVDEMQMGGGGGGGQRGELPLQ